VEHTDKYFDQVGTIAATIDRQAITHLAEELAALRERGGRLFMIGVGGSAGNCSHAVNDFRKLCGIEAYAPTDNVPELTARANDEGWETVFEGWLKISRISSIDAVFVFSVGGGDLERNVSVNIIRAVDLAKLIGARVLGVVGRLSGYTAKNGDAVVVVPTPDNSLVTPHCEAFQAVVWHCLVSHPLLQMNHTKW
jgi:D-sedoheptulose 7-phosphate isomerase